jgi:1,4-alpha-glucan branching enzyme
MSYETKQKAKRRKVNFQIWAPAAKAVSLMGSFNQWNAKTHPMKKDRDGYWHKSIMAVPGRYEYRYLIDGCWENDPANSHCCPNEYGTFNNVVEVFSQ